MRQVDLGQDPESALESALVFVGTRAKEPLPVELKADRMLIYWRLAERSFSRGDAPGPALEEALKHAGHTTFLHRDYLGEVLNFKARMEAAQGVDPRPTLTTTLARLQPQLDATPSWSLCETAAETWLLQAEWEAGHGQNPAPSLAKAQELTERALRGNSNSATAYALKGLERLLQARTAPADHAIQLLMAQERLKLAETLAPAGRLQARLRQALERRP
jgi:hypothetical protein